METNPSSSLFDLSFSQDAKSQIADAARWARIFAICGMILIGLLVTIGIIAAFIVSKTAGQYDNGYNNQTYGTGVGIGVMLVYIVVGVIYFFPFYFTLLFANKIKLGLLSNDDLLLTESFRNLKKAFRYLAVLGIIGVFFFLLALLGGGLSALTSFE